MTPNKFQYKHRSPYHLFLRLLEPEPVFSTLIGSLAPLGKAIRECDQNIDLMESEGDDGLEDIITQEAEITETLIGTTFVVCQAHIACVVSRAMELHTFFQKREKRDLKAIDNSKQGILKQGAQLLDGSRYTDIQAMDAFANYFKHRDEWPNNWAKIAKKHRRTRNVISAFGAISGSHGNLRMGAEVLGYVGGSSVMVFADRLESWRKKLKNDYEAQLKLEGVI